MSIELKIKAMSLAAEAKIIRNQERRITRNLRKRRVRLFKRGIVVNVAPAMEELQGIRSHRIFDLRREARATCWARAFIAGKPKPLIENISNETEAERKLLCLAAGRMVLRHGKLPPRCLGDNRTDLALAADAVDAWQHAACPSAILAFISARYEEGRKVAKARKAAGRKYWAAKVMET